MDIGRNGASHGSGKRFKRKSARRMTIRSGAKMRVRKRNPKGGDKKPRRKVFLWFPKICWSNKHKQWETRWLEYAEYDTTYTEMRSMLDDHWKFTWVEDDGKRK